MLYGLNEILKNLDRAEAEIVKQGAKAMEIASLATEAHIKKEFQRQRTGKGFTDRTGTLRRSIGHHVIIESKSYIMGVVYAGTYYAVYVECRWNGKYAYLLPGLMEMKGKIWTILEKTLKAIF